MKRPTITDVARKANVSKSTVSHVINGTRFVEEATKKRVLRAIDDLGYRPSAVARSLTTNKTQTIGVIVSDLTNRFWGEMIRSIEEVLGAANYSLLVSNTDEVLELEERYLNLMLSQQVDGIIAAATSQRWEALDLAEVKNLPIVFLDREFEGMDQRPYVGVDNQAGAYLGTKHLIECGYTEIGVIAGFQRLSSMRGRLAGFQQALSDYGLHLPEEWVGNTLLTPEAARAATRQILSLPHRPQALFINNNFLSLGVLLALDDMGLSCPEDIGLVGFDDHPWAAICNPPLTVVRQPVVELGRHAANIMLQLINDEVPSQTQVTLDCDLVIRRSCGK